MLRRHLALVALLIPLAASAQTPPAQLAWTRILPNDLEKFEATASQVRLNNLVIARANTDPDGVATAHEFTASIANRNAEGRRVMIELVGARQDGLPTLTADSFVDVAGRRNETLTARMLIPEEAVRQTAVFYLRMLVIVP